MKKFWIFNLTKCTAVILTITLIGTNVLFANATETNFWSQRQKSLQGAKEKKHEPLQVASLPASLQSNPSQFLNNLPTLARPVTAISKRVQTQLPKGSEDRYSALIGALPLAYGNVRNLVLPSKTDNKKTVIYLQDVHMNPEAQENIGKALQALIDKKVVGLVGLEGAFKPLDLSFFRQFPDRKSVQVVADYFLNEKRIAGPLHTALTSPTTIPDFVGVDHPQHYRANVAAYQQSAPLIKGQKNRQAQYAQNLQEKKTRTFNQKLLEFDARIDAYHQDKLSWGDYVRTLASHTSAPSHQIEIFLAALKDEAALDFKRVENERVQLVSKLLSKLSQADTAQLLDHSVAYRMGNLSHSGFYQYLKDLCQNHGVSLNNFQAMDGYIRYVLLSDAIDIEQVLQDAAAMESKTYTALSKTPEEKRLIAESHQLFLLGRLLDFSLTPEEWKEYQANRAALDFAGLQTFEAFYQEAQQRDLAMTNNLIRAMDRSQASVAVLVTGGFHSAGVTAQLKEQGVASIVFAPKITKVDDADGSSYLSVFTQDKTPLDRIFRGEKLFTAPLVFPSDANELFKGAVGGVAQVTETSNGTDSRIINTMTSQFKIQFELAGGKIANLIVSVRSMGKFIALKNSLIASLTGGTLYLVINNQASLIPLLALAVPLTLLLLLLTKRKSILLILALLVSYGSNPATGIAKDFRTVQQQYFTAVPIIDEEGGVSEGKWPPLNPYLSDGYTQKMMEYRRMAEADWAEGKRKYREDQGKTEPFDPPSPGFLRTMLRETILNPNSSIEDKKDAWRRLEAVDLRLDVQLALKVLKMNTHPAFTSLVVDELKETFELNEHVRPPVEIIRAIKALLDDPSTHADILPSLREIITVYDRTSGVDILIARARAALPDPKEVLLAPLFQEEIAALIQEGVLPTNWLPAIRLQNGGTINDADQIVGRDIDGEFTPGTVIDGKFIPGKYIDEEYINKVRQSPDLIKAYVEILITKPWATHAFVKEVLIIKMEQSPDGKIVYHVDGNTLSQLTEQLPRLLETLSEIGGVDSSVIENFLTIINPTILAQTTKNLSTENPYAGFSPAVASTAEKQVEHNRMPQISALKGGIKNFSNVKAVKIINQSGGRTVNPDSRFFDETVAELRKISFAPPSFFSSLRKGIPEITNGFINVSFAVIVVAFLIFGVSKNIIKSVKAVKKQKEESPNKKVSLWDYLRSFTGTFLHTILLGASLVYGSAAFAGSPEPIKEATLNVDSGHTEEFLSMVTNSASEWINSLGTPNPDKEVTKERNDSLAEWNVLLDLAHIAVPATEASQITPAEREKIRSRLLAAGVKEAKLTGPEFIAFVRSSPELTTKYVKLFASTPWPLHQFLGKLLIVEELTDPNGKVSLVLDNRTAEIMQRDRNSLVTGMEKLFFNPREFEETWKFLAPVFLSQKVGAGEIVGVLVETFLPRVTKGQSQEAKEKLLTVVSPIANLSRISLVSPDGSVVRTIDLDPNEGNQILAQISDRIKNRPLAISTILFALGSFVSLFLVAAQFSRKIQGGATKKWPNLNKLILLLSVTGASWISGSAAIASPITSPVAVQISNSSLASPIVNPKSNPLPSVSIEELTADIRQELNSHANQEEILANIQTREGTVSLDLAHSFRLNSTKASTRVRNALFTGLNLAVKSEMGQWFNTMTEALNSLFITKKNNLLIVFINELADIPKISEAAKSIATRNEANKKNPAAIIVVIRENADAQLSERVQEDVRSWMPKISIGWVEEDPGVADPTYHDLFLKGADLFKGNSNASFLLTNLAEDVTDEAQVMVIGTPSKPYTASKGLLSIMIVLLPISGRTLMIDIGAVWAAAIMA